MQKKYNEQTEKLTVNINHIDLGKIDLLVENGFFSNRSDLIRTAIRNELGRNEKFISETIEKDSFVIGISKYKVEDFEKVIKDNKVLNIKHIGLLIIDKKVTLELLEKAVNTFDVKGTLIASSEVKAYLNNKG